MDKALYYPFTGPESGKFIKEALLLWESVEFIVPWKGYKQRVSTKEEEEAIELVGKNYVPTEDDQNAAHQELEDFCTGPNASNSAFQLENPNVNYEFYPQKLLSETWEMLSQSKMADVSRSGGEISRAATGRMLGYYMMSVLATCCSHGRKRLVTDSADPYKALANVIVEKGTPQDQWHSRVLAIPLPGMDLTSVTIADLLALRKNESDLMTAARSAFTAKVEQTAVELAKQAENSQAVEEITQDYTSAMTRELRELNRVLASAGRSILLSREFLMTIMAAAMIAPLSVPGAKLLTIGGLCKGWGEYRDRRRKLLSESPAAWPMAIAGPPIRFA